MKKKLKGTVPFKLTFKEIRRISELKAPGILARVPVKTPLLTGTKVIDSLIPIGRGQRELIIGDRQTGKTCLGLDIILANASANCKYRVKKNKIEALREILWFVYCFIGQKSSTILEVINEINKKSKLVYKYSNCNCIGSSCSSVFGTIRGMFKW